MNDMLGSPKKINSTERSIKIIYQYNSLDKSQRRFKIEINVREILPEKDLQKIPYSVKSDYFTGNTDVVAFQTEEMIGTKIRALYQRNKGRDLFDLYEVGKTDANWDSIVSSFKNLKIGASRLDYNPK